jgi:hypothetical protein
VNCECERRHRASLLVAIAVLTLIVAARVDAQRGQGARYLGLADPKAVPPSTSPERGSVITGLGLRMVTPRKGITRASDYACRAEDRGRLGSGKGRSGGRAMRGMAPGHPPDTRGFGSVGKTTKR